jgi:hypothetical protein
MSGSLGVDRKTIRKYVAPAVAAGIMPGGPAKSEQEWRDLVREWFLAVARTVRVLRQPPLVQNVTEPRYRHLIMDRFTIWRPRAVTSVKGQPGNRVTERCRQAGAAEFSSG